MMNSQTVWQMILSGESREKFEQVAGQGVPLTKNAVSKAVDALKTNMADNADHPMHKYIDQNLDLKSTLNEKLQSLTPTEFEQVIHPIFSEDEILLLVAGAAVGALAGCV